jgi:nicotinamide-nucleotide amidase
MQAEIISIGDELLIGQTVNTNASWLGEQLSLIGIAVKNGQTISDERRSIIEAFDLAFSRSELIIVTGGLGPTKDDITKHVLCEYFDTSLQINQEALDRITSYFTKRGRPMLDVNVQQAALPKSCKVIHNQYGTACGMWFEKSGRILISLPGVPYEMKGMMLDVLLAELKSYFNVEGIYHETILTTGIGESFLAEKIQDWENEIRAEGLGLAYLPSPGIVKLRVTSPHGTSDKQKVSKYLNQVEKLLPFHVFGREQQTLSSVLGEIAKNKGIKIGTVESCTGGGIANSLVQTAGSSAYFMGSFVTYSNELKVKLAGVKQESLDSFGAVSEVVVQEMAQGGLRALELDYCVAVSGVAGPDGGTEEKPVGTVWISVASKQGVENRKFNFGDNRERTIQMTIFAALNMLRCHILEIKA